jgi:hypothetical protein
VTAAQGSPRPGGLWLVLAQLRAKLWWRSLGKAQLVTSAIILAGSAALSIAVCVLLAGTVSDLGKSPKALARLEAQGGPAGLFTVWLTTVLLGRIWFALITLNQTSSLFDLRRFRIYPVPPRLLSLMNFAGLFFEPTWLLIYPVLVALAVGVSWLPGAPQAPALLLAEALAVFATGGVLHLAAAAGAALDARPLLRRGFSLALVLASLAGYLDAQLSSSKSPWMLQFFAAHRALIVAWTPPGWAAQLAQDLSSGRYLQALRPALLMAAAGLAFSLVAHEIASRDLLRPAEDGRAGKGGRRAAGLRLPFLPGSFSALFEKEVKTALRAGWLQFVVMPVMYLVLVRTVFAGPEPLLIAAVYAHLGVLDLATNIFGRDVAGARAWFLWPVSLREVLAAKNAVAYVFSLVIYAVLGCVGLVTANATAGQFLIGLLAHAALFPLLAALGNAASVLSPIPVRGARLRRVRGAGPVGIRLGAMAILGVAAWAPYGMARATGLRLGAAYTGEMIAMAVVYLGTLSAGARLVETRREPMLAALSKDE